MCLIVNCSICLEEITNKNKCTTSCNHQFCLECILIHFQQNKKCPLCRSNLISNERSRLRSLMSRNERSQLQSIISRNERAVDNNNNNIRLISEMFSYSSDLSVIMSGIENYDDNSDDEIPDLEFPVLEEPI